MTPSAQSPAMISPAPARMSVARTGAPESRSRPRTTAWWPSVLMSAPSRIISLANMNRPSKMFSVIREAPSLTAASPIAIGSRSVAKPGYGSVTTSTACGRSSIRTRKASPRVSTSRTGGDQLVQRDLQERRLDPGHGDVAPGHRRAERPGAGDDPVPDRGVPHRAQRGHPLDVQGGGAGAGDPGAHRGQHRADVDDLRLPGGVVDHAWRPGPAPPPSPGSRWRRRWGSPARSRRRAARAAPRRSRSRARRRSRRPSGSARRRACPDPASRWRRRPGGPPARSPGGPAAGPARRSRPAAGGPGRSRPRRRAARARR